jgi:hypothetical protein
MKPESYKNGRTTLRARNTMRLRSVKRALLAFLLSILTPGLGQIYNGQLTKGALCFAGLLGFFLVSTTIGMAQHFAGFILHSLPRTKSLVKHSLSTGPRINRESAEPFASRSQFPVISGAIRCLAIEQHLLLSSRPKGIGNGTLKVSVGNRRNRVFCRLVPVHAI